MLIYCPDKYITQEICDEAVGDCRVPLKFVPDWLVKCKMLKKFHDALNANDDILFFDEDFSKVSFSANQMGILDVDLDKINLDDDNNFDEDHSEIIIHVRLLAWSNKFEKREVLKKDISEELMSIAWHPARLVLIK